jgi:hypothetical protein
VRAASVQDTGCAVNHANVPRSQNPQNFEILETDTSSEDL